METSEFVNSIADALTAVLGKDVYGVVSSIKDDKFPVYVLHSITLRTFDGEWSTRVELRVHSKEVSKECAFRKLTTKLLSLLFRSTAQGELAVHREELKY